VPINKTDLDLSVKDKFPKYYAADSIKTDAEAAARPFINSSFSVISHIIPTQLEQVSSDESFQGFQETGISIREGLFK